MPCLDPVLRHQLEHIAQALPGLWDGGQLTNEHKKLLLRSLIARVILRRTVPDQVEVKVVWVSGHFSVGYLVPPIHRQADVSRYDEMVARVHDLWQEGHPDTEVAVILTREGFHSARSLVVSETTVAKIRDQHDWFTSYHLHRLSVKVDGHWTIHGLSQELGVDRNWFYRRIYHGTLKEPDVIRKPPFDNYLIRDNPVLIQRLRGEAERSRRRPAKPRS